MEKNGRSRRSLSSAILSDNNCFSISEMCYFWSKAVINLKSVTDYLSKVGLSSKVLLFVNYRGKTIFDQFLSVDTSWKSEPSKTVEKVKNTLNIRYFKKHSIRPWTIHVNLSVQAKRSVSFILSCVRTGRLLPVAWPNVYLFDSTC